MFSRKKTALALESLAAEITALRSEVAEHVRALETERETVRSVGERLGLLEARVSSMGTELSRQIHELGNEIDGVARQADEAGLGEMVTSLRESQVRLAAEQARYEITFRQDLAALADQLLRRAR
ncbi:MAG: hypothetical protein ACKOQ7_00530 [Actinomycetota bacterium]